MADPYPKQKQLARGERRYRRKIASPKQWQAIVDAKRGPCRVCGTAPQAWHSTQYHHLVPRSLGGDDVADNIVPLGYACHVRITQAVPPNANLEALAASLTDGEYAYVIGKLGEGAMERLFGVLAVSRLEKENE